MRRIYRDKKEFLILAFTAFIVGAYILRPELFSDLGFAPFGVAALVIGYFSGMLAISVGVFYTVATFITALPVIATVYGFIVFSIARIHYAAMKWLTMKALRRNRRYQEFKVKVKESRAYRVLKAVFNRVLMRSGIGEPHPLKVFKIKRCISCGEDMPLDGGFCPFCGNRA